MQRTTVLLSKGKSLKALESGPRNLVLCKLNLGVDGRGCLERAGSGPEWEGGES